MEILTHIIIFFQDNFVKLIPVTSNTTATPEDTKVKKPTRPPGAKLPSSQTQPTKSTKKSFTGTVFSSLE